MEMGNFMPEYFTCSEVVARYKVKTLTVWDWIRKKSSLLSESDATIESGRKTSTSSRKNGKQHEILHRKEAKTMNYISNPAMQLVKEVKETTDIKEVAELLSKSKWIARFATSGENPTFVLGRV